jgi:hypothetical protein
LSAHAGWRGRCQGNLGDAILSKKAAANGTTQEEQIRQDRRFMPLPDYRFASCTTRQDNVAGWNSPR